MNNLIEAIMKPFMKAAKPLATLLFTIALVVAGGCAKSGSMSMTKGEEAEDKMMMGKDLHEVFSGESLWTIAEYEDIYNDPYQWPLLYKNNIDQIEDADLIHPGQKLVVRRDETSDSVSRAIEHAKSRGAWFLGLIEAADQEYLQGN